MNITDISNISNIPIDDFQDICFPSISKSIPLNYIFKIICILDVGKIKQILEIPNYSKPDYKKVVVKMKWNELSSRVQYIQSRFMEEKSITIVHNNKTILKAFPNHIHLRQK